MVQKKITFVVVLACSLLILACSNSDDSTHLTDQTNAEVDELPDSTTLHSDLDTLNFAQECEERGHFDIAARYYKYLTNSWNGLEDCASLAMEGFIGLATTTKEKEKIDTNLVLTYMDSAAMACPYGNQPMMQAVILCDLKMDSVEYYLNQSYRKNHPVDIINRFVRENLGCVDTNELEFDWKRLY